MTNLLINFTHSQWANDYYLSWYTTTYNVKYNVITGIKQGR